MVAAIAISGRLDFNPLTDSLINSNGEKVKLDEPTGWELPPKGFEVKDNGYLYYSTEQVVYRQKLDNE